MKRLVAGLILVACTVPLLAPSNAPSVSLADLPTAASGQGSMSFGKDGHGVGFFLFQVASGDPVTGSLVFAAEDHHRYPDIIVRMEAIDKVGFRARAVSFSGQGRLHDEDVHVSATGYDGEGTKKPDTFTIRCTNNAGEIVFEASGEVFIGNVTVGSAQ